MFKVIFKFLTESLGLPIEWSYGYVILAVIGTIAYVIAYKIVGNMYQIGVIDGRTQGSFFHWLIRFVIFAVLWAVIYGVIWVGKLIIANWEMISLVACGIVGAAVLYALAVFIIKKVMAVKNNA